MRQYYILLLRTFIPTICGDFYLKKFYLDISIKSFIVDLTINFNSINILKINLKQKKWKKQ